MRLPTRRAVIAGGAAGAVLSAARANEARALMELDSVPRRVLWPGPPPGGLRAGAGLSGPPRPTRHGAIDHIAAPFLAIFRPERPNGAAMLVSGGGGYEYIEIGPEALPAARWLNSLGITAYVLGYRLPPEGWAGVGLAPLADAQRAIRLIRAGAAADRLDPHRVGVMGFSAGGHLSAMAATSPSWPAYPPIDAADRLSDRPALAMLVYPVITVEAPYQTTHTARVLLAGDDGAANAARWSAQTHVGRATPPVFMAQAQDDPVASPDNTAIMLAACQAAGVPCERHLYATGGHGFGMGRPGTASMLWSGPGRAWLAARGFASP